MISLLGAAHIDDAQIRDALQASLATLARNRTEQIGHAAGTRQAPHHHLRQTERCDVGRNYDVALQRKLEPPAKTIPVHCGDDRLAQIEAAEVEQTNIEPALTGGFEIEAERFGHSGFSASRCCQISADTA